MWLLLLIDAVGIGAGLGAMIRGHWLLGGVLLVGAVYFVAESLTG